MQGFARQLFDYDGSNLYPKTHPGAFVSSIKDDSAGFTNATGIRTVGELIDTVTPSYEPEFVYRVNGTDSGIAADASGQLCAAKISDIFDFNNAVLATPLTVTNFVGIAGTVEETSGTNHTYSAGTRLETIIREILTQDSIYDVIPHDPSIDINVITDSSLILQSKYDVETGENTGIWAGDDIYASYNSATMTVTDGYFTPQPGYNDFDTINQAHGATIIGSNKMLANCPVNPSSGIKIKLNSNASTTVPGTIQYDASNEFYNIDINETDILLDGSVTSGTNSVITTILYAENQDKPYRSNNTLSLVGIPAGSFTLTNTFNVSTDKDVTKENPKLDIVGATVDNINYLDGSTVTGHYDGETISGTINVIYKDGRFKPLTGYNNTTFDNNNTGSYIENDTHYHDAGCELTSLNESINSSTIALTPHGSGSYNFTGTFTNGALTINLFGVHGISNYTPRKLSNRDSSVNIPGDNIQSDTFTLYADSQSAQYHYHLLSIDSSNESEINYVTDVLNDAYDYSQDGLLIQNPYISDISTCNAPTTYTLIGNPLIAANTVGRKYKAIVAIAPEGYNTVEVYTNDNEHIFDSSTVLNSIPYSSTDPTLYKVFIGGDGGKWGYDEVKKFEIKTL